MHHKYVVRDRSLGLDGLDELDGRLVVTRGERDRRRRLARSSPGRTRSTSSSSGRSAIVEEAGRVEPRPVHVDGIEIRPWFCPGYGDALSHRIAKAIGRAKRRVRICSPVITAAPVLATLAQVDRRRQGRRRRRGRPCRRCEDVQRQWGPNGVAVVEAPAPARADRARAAFAGKRSTPWGPGTVHDYMHAKVTVADDVVFLGIVQPLALRRA